MRNILSLIILAASLAHAAWTDYQEKRDLSLDAADVRHLRIDSGAGSLEISGVPGRQSIDVTAVIKVPHADSSKAKDTIRKHMVLTLERDGADARLESRFESDGHWFGDSPTIDLDVRVPQGLSLAVADGSGSLEIRDVAGDIDVHDGSGSVRMTKVGGRLEVEDGSGALEISDAGGDVSVVDGSGSITLRGIRGSATIRDGSGSIEVADVGGDLEIPEAGSGAVDVRGVQGRYEGTD